MVGASLSGSCEGEWYELHFYHISHHSVSTVCVTVFDALAPSVMNSIVLESSFAKSVHERVSVQVAPATPGATPSGSRR